MMKLEEWKQFKQKKRKAADEGLAKREERVRKVKEDEKEENLLRKIKGGLKEDERDGNAKHIENLKAKEIRFMREKQMSEETRILKEKAFPHQFVMLLKI
jgi:hypothetical protein